MGWSLRGWSQESHYFLWWFFAMRPDGPRLEFGEHNINNRLDKDMGSAASPLMQKVAVVAHRYALGKGKQESNRDRLTWHTLVVVEWDHGKNVTVIELANLNGVGGRRGKSNWCLDMDEPVPALY